MEELKKYYNEAGSYSKTALGAFKNKRLGNIVVYNLIGLAIENYLTALCMKFNLLPEHSSISSMLHLLKKQVEIPESFKTESRFINKFMNFCSLEILETPEPDDSDIVRMLRFTDDIKHFAEEILGTTIESVT
ncbi:MAG: hypothetical protein JXR61_07080 [Prolixibacteraceae bacterium]|nr:hypothetical protein [Prolixibacteraceae bacterium]